MVLTMIRDRQKVEEIDLEYFKNNPNEISYERKPYPGEFIGVPKPPTGFGDLLTKATWVVVTHMAPGVVMAIPTLKNIAAHQKGRVRGFRVMR